MIISLEGLPGCRQDEICQQLKLKDIEVKKCTPKSIENGNGFCYQLDWLSRYALQQDDSFSVHESIYAYKELYPTFSAHKNWYHLTDYEGEIFSRYCDLHYRSPDVIIYLYGNLEKCYERTTPLEQQYSFEDFKELYYQFEWTFDVTTCKVPMYKINVEDDIENVVLNIAEIFSKIKENK